MEDETDMRSGATVSLEIDNINFDDGYVTFKLEGNIRWVGGRYEIRCIPQDKGEEDNASDQK